MIKMHSIFVALPEEENKLQFARLIVEYDNILLEFYEKVGRLPKDVTEAITWLNEIK